MGPQIRTGALDAAGRIVDLRPRAALTLIDEGLAPDAAARLSPRAAAGRHGGADRRRRALARRGTPRRSTGRPTTSRRRRADRRSGNGARMRCRQIPRPPMLRDFMGFETHLLNIYPKLGREIPPEWFKLPVYYKGNPGSVAAHGDDDRRSRRTAARRSISSSSWRW